MTGMLRLSKVFFLFFLMQYSVAETPKHLKLFGFSDKYLISFIHILLGKGS